MTKPESLEDKATCDCAHLKEYVLAIIEEREKRYTQRMNSQDAAIAKAEQTRDNQLALMNEFCGSLVDQSATFLRRAEYELQHKSLEHQFTTMQNEIVAIKSRNKGVGIIAGIVILVLTMLISAAGVAVDLIFRK